MPKFPETSAVKLASKRPAVRLLRAGALLWRLYFHGGTHPTSWDGWRAFGPTESRFDHHSSPTRVQKREILYAATSGLVCIAECFQHTRVIDRVVRDPRLVAFETSADLRLLDLTGYWPTYAGASTAIATGPRPRAQRWSRAIYEAYSEIDGLYYPSSMAGNEPAIALYERAKASMPTDPSFDSPLSNPVLLPALKNVARKIGYGLV